MKRAAMLLVAALALAGCSGSTKAGAPSSPPVSADQRAIESLSQRVDGLGRTVAADDAILRQNGLAGGGFTTLNLQTLSTQLASPQRTVECLRSYIETNQPRFAVSSCRTARPALSSTGGFLASPSLD